jgi:hypothetical protein
MSSNGIFTASVFNTLKPVLEAIVDDKRDNVESSLVWPMYADKKKQTDHYEDFLEMSGPSLASEKEEMAPRRRHHALPPSYLRPEANLQ